MVCCLTAAFPNVGGETIFPLEGPDGMKVLQHIDYRSCKDGYMVLPFWPGCFLHACGVNLRYTSQDMDRKL